MTYLEVIVLFLFHFITFSSSVFCQFHLEHIITKIRSSGLTTATKQWHWCPHHQNMFFQCIFYYRCPLFEKMAVPPKYLNSRPAHETNKLVARTVQALLTQNYDLQILEQVRTKPKGHEGGLGRFFPIVHFLNKVGTEVIFYDSYTDATMVQYINHARLLTCLFHCLPTFC